MNKVKNTIGFLAIFLFFLTLAIAIVINFTPFYRLNVALYDVAETTGLTEGVIMENYRILIRYLNFPWISDLDMPSFPSSESGLFHFYEVKRLFSLNYIVLLVSGVIGFVYLRYKKNSRELWELINPTRIMAIFPLILLVFVALNFNQLFVTFHKLFFNNDAWIFNAQTDPIILALPQGFFMNCFIFVFVFIEICLWAVHFWAKRKGLGNN